MTFHVVLPLVSVAVIFLARMFELRTKRETVPGPVKEQTTFRLFLLVGTSMLAGGIVEYLLRNQMLYGPTFLAGVACGVSSFLLRRRAITALGKFWSLHVEIRENHEFVRSGPFRWMRHPTYFSMVLELLALGLILNAFIALAVSLVFFVPILCWRIRIEEGALVEKFGSLYVEYQNSTPALFPYKWTSHK